MREKILKNLLEKIEIYELTVTIDEKFIRKVSHVEDIMFQLSKCHEEYYDCTDFEFRIHDALNFVKLLKTRDRTESENWRENVNIQFRNAICEKINNLLLHKMKHHLMIEPEVIACSSDFRQRVELIEHIILYDICKSNLDYYNYKCLYQRTSVALKMANEKYINVE
jgi:hypothetical protein